MRDLMLKYNRWQESTHGWIGYCPVQPPCKKAVVRLQKHNPYNFLHCMPIEALCSVGARLLLLVGHRGCEGREREREPPGLGTEPLAGSRSVGHEGTNLRCGGASLWRADTPIRCIVHWNSIWSHIRTNDHQCNHIVIDICCKGATFIGRSYFGVPSAIFNGMGPKSRNGHQRNPTRFPSPGSPFLLQLLQLLIWNLILHDVACDGVITAARIQSINKKEAHTRSPSVGFRS